MATLLVINTSPYGSEGPYNALRLASALALGDEPVDVFLMGDAVHTARRGQEPRGAQASLEEMLGELIAKGAAVSACGTCCQTRGLAADDLVDGVDTATIHDLAQLTLTAGRQLSF